MSKVSTTGRTEESVQWSDLPNWHTSLRFCRRVEYSLAESLSFREPRFTRSGFGIQPRGIFKILRPKAFFLSKSHPVSSILKALTLDHPTAITNRTLLTTYQNHSRSVFTTPISSSWTLSATAMDFDALPVSFRFRPFTPALSVWNAGIPCRFLPTPVLFSAC
jgi:hypothetical protein